MRFHYAKIRIDQDHSIVALPRRREPEARRPRVGPAGDRLDQLARTAGRLVRGAVHGSIAAGRAP